MIISPVNTLGNAGLNSRSTISLHHKNDEHPLAVALKIQWHEANQCKKQSKHMYTAASLNYKAHMWSKTWAEIKTPTDRNS